MMMMMMMMDDGDDGDDDDDDVDVFMMRHPKGSSKNHNLYVSLHYFSVAVFCYARREEKMML